MGKLISIIGGTVAVVLGLMLIVAWNQAFVLGFQFMIMLVLVLGGLIAVIAGISEIKDTLLTKKEEEKASETKKEEDKK